MSVEMIKSGIRDLQKRLGCQLQVTIYNSSLNDQDELVQAARDCRMSIITENSGEWGAEENCRAYAVRVVAEGFGEIPYALMVEEIYLEGYSFTQEAN